MNILSRARPLNVDGARVVLDKPLVLHIITGLGTGGAELMLARLVQASTSFRHMVVSLTDEGSLAPGLRRAGIEVVTLGLSPGPTALLGIVRLARLIHGLRPAVVQTWLYHADLLGTLASRLAGCRRIIWNLRCSDMDEQRYGKLVALLARLSGIPPIILSNSEAGKAWHQSRGYRPGVWAVIANGIDCTRFRPDSEARAFWRQKLGIGEKTVLVGMVARTDPMKDHALFLAMATTISGIRSDVAFILAGRGTESLPDGPCLRLGEIADIPGLYAAMDVAVSASRFGEGFPNAVAEAMACALPVVASDSGDTARIIARAGVTIPIGDEPAMTREVLALIDAPERRRDLGGLARMRVEREFSLEATVLAYEALWRQQVPPHER